MKHKRQRLSLDTRISSMLNAALRLAEKHGYINVTSTQIAEAAQCSRGLIDAHIGNMQQVRRAIMREAVRRESLVVVLQGLALRDPIALRAPVEVKQRALATVGA